jgi:NAD(P)-dependent dehydrogenase (short-subunit alcohol dehydrogenase family)
VSESATVNVAEERASQPVGSKLTGRVALVTGGTRGIGAAISEELASQGATVAAGFSGNVERADQFARDFADRFSAPVSTHRGNVASPDDCRRVINEVLEQHGRLDILINNAGIGTAGTKRQVSSNGYELRFAVNYLAGFLLTSELLPLLKASAPARIVNVASAGQQAIDFDDVMLTRSYDGVRAYCQSKLAQIMFTIDLAQELKNTGVTANSLHPASYMNTTMVRQAGVTPWSSVETGADAILNLAISPDLEGRSGLYFDGQRESRADAQAYDAKARQQLRTLSLDLVSLSRPP